MFLSALPVRGRLQLRSFQNRACVTFRRALAVLALLVVPGVSLATTFTDTSAGATFQVTSPPLGGIDSCYLLQGAHVYASRTLTTNNTTNYTFRITSVSGFGNDPFLAVYRGTFDPANPTQNLVACNDDYNDLLSQFSADLTANTTYTVVTTSYGTNVGGAATYEVTPDVTLAGAPVLSNVGVSGVSTTSALLTGTSSSEGTSYYVVQLASEAAPSSTQVIAGQQSTGAAALVSGSSAVAANTAQSFPLSPLLAGTSYIAYLVARDNQSTPLNSVPVGASFSTASVVSSAPIIGAATASDAQATVSFSAPLSDGGSAITSYTVTSNPGAITATGTASPVTVAGLINGTAYTFTVTATNGAGASASSNPSNAVTPIGPSTLSAFGPFNKTYGDALFTLTAPTSDSSGAFTYTSSNPAVAIVNGDVVTILSAGTAVVTANQAADAGHTAGSITANLVVANATPTVASFGDMTATFGDAPITLTAPSSPSAGAFTYAIDNASVATISGNVVSIVGAGTAVITATQAADGSYGSTQVTAQLTVQAATPVLSGFPAISATFGDAPITLSAPASQSTGAFTYASDNAAVASIDGLTLTIHGAGTANITATQAAQGNYGAATITATVIISAKAPTITGFSDLHKVYGQAAFDLVDPVSNSGGAFSYSIDNAAVATVNGRRITITGPGSATITATQAATANYASASVTASLVVDGRPDPTKDAEVVGVLQAQSDVALRFASAQQSNVRDRLRQRRASDAAGTANGLSVSAVGGDGMSLTPELVDGQRQSYKGWSLWTGGNIATGQRDNRTGSAGNTLRSDGITVGADTRVGKDVLLGLAAGGGWNKAIVGEHGSQVDAKQRAVTAYGLWRPSQALFVDGQLAYGKLDYDLRRWSADADTLALSQRDGAQVFGSLTVGYDTVTSGGRITGYSRLDAGRTTLNAYRESGLGIYDLDYREQHVDQRSLALGIEGSYSIGADWKRAARPFWSVEYRNDFSRRSDALMNYVVAPADQDYRLALTPWSSSNWSLGLGSDFALGNGVIMTAQIRHEINVGQGQNTTFGVQLSIDLDGGTQNGVASQAPSAGQHGSPKNK